MAPDLIFSGLSGRGKKCEARGIVESTWSGPYLWTVCQAGAEKALKAEFARLHPGWKPSFGRPGFQTWKRDSDGAWDAGLESVFARAWGLALGREPDWDEWARRMSAVSSEEWALHAFARVGELPSSRPSRPGISEGLAQVAERAVSELRKRGARIARMAGRAREGQPVLDVIEVDEGVYWYGAHLQSQSLNHKRIAYPGAEFPWPEHDVPSRAYLKCNEAIEFAGFAVEEGEIALEWGSAPGGACLALLEKGLHVIGVDPGEMDPRVAEYAREADRDFLFLRKLAGSLQPHELPPTIHWLFSDMNIAPEQTLSTAARWIPDLRRRGLRGVALTLKLTDWGFAEKFDEVLARTRKDWGLSRAGLKQLSQHRQEVLFYGSF